MRGDGERNASGGGGKRNVRGGRGERDVGVGVGGGGGGALRPPVTLVGIDMVRIWGEIMLIRTSSTWILEKR